MRTHSLGSALLDDKRLAQVRRQARPRRWPWQPKTLRDHVDEYRAHVAAVAGQQGAEVLKIARRQSQPRSWPWQSKTIRDLLDEGGTELLTLSADMSAALTKAVEERRDALLTAAQQQARPRRWPWQPKTVRDNVAERSARLATIAAEQSAQLAALAKVRRDALAREAQRQISPRRWPWQPRTLRDQLDDRRARGEQAVAEQVKVAGERLQGFADQSSSSVQEHLNGAGERAQHLRDTVPHAIGAAASSAGDSLRGAAHGVSSAIGGAASSAGGSLRGAAHGVSSAIDSATSAASGSLRGAAHGVSSAISATADSAATTVQRPITAVSRSVESGKREIRHGVSLVRTAFWSLLIGIGAGLLLSRIPREDLERFARIVGDELMQAGRQRADQWQQG